MFLQVPAQGPEQQDESHGQKTIGLHSSLSTRDSEKAEFQRGKASHSRLHSLKSNSAVSHTLTPNLSSQTPIPTQAASNPLLDQIPDPAQPEASPARTLLCPHYLPKDMLGLLPGTLAWPQDVLQQEGEKGGGSVAGQEGASLLTGEARGFLQGQWDPR